MILLRRFWSFCRMSNKQIISKMIDFVNNDNDILKDAMKDDRDFGFIHDYESSHANKKDHIAVASIIGYILSFRYDSSNHIKVKYFIVKKI